MSDAILGARKLKNLSFVEKLINERKYALIDVRNPVDYRDGSILNAPNAPLRNFITVFAKKRRDTNKIILIGSNKDKKDLEACIRYAINFNPPDNKELNISYLLYDELVK